MQTVKTGFGMGNVNASTSSFYLSVVALTQKCYQGRAHGAPFFPSHFHQRTHGHEPF